MRVIESGETPFRWWRVADLVYPDLVRAARWNIPPETWPEWVRYSNDAECGKRTTRKLDSQHYAITDLASRLNSSQMAFDLGRETIGEACSPDPDMHGAGLHVTDPGGWLQVHVDYEVHPRLEGWERRLNLILWLNESWKPEWGGALILCDPNGSPERRFYPAPGEAVLFEGGATAYHGAMQTAPDAPARLTLAAYYLAPSRLSATRKRACFLPNRDSPGCPRECAIFGV
jgi:2OG-Fe(II) oxygenase superfamily